jgi:hypothetical protein
MELIKTWLMDLNIFSIALTAWATYTISINSQKKEFEKGIQQTEKAKQEIIQEIRGEISSLKSK